MSAYLSPIMSSGDTTPPQQAANENQQRQQVSVSNQTKHQIPNQNNQISKSVNPFQTRVEISTEEIAQKLCQNRLKSQQSQSVGPNKRQKTTSLRSMGNSMLVNEFSSSSSANSSGDELEQRAAAKAVVLNCFRKRHEQEMGAQSDEEDEEEEEEAGEAEEELFGQRMENSQGSASRAKENKRQQAQQEASYTNAGTNSSHNHQTLAEQFLQADNNKQAGAGAFRLNYDHSKGHQFHELLAGFSARSSRLVGGGERLEKKFKQILQSIPMVPTLLATTSIMTLVLLLCLLLLSDTPRATAMRDQRDHVAPLQSPAEEDHRRESLVNMQPSLESTPDGAFKFVLGDEATAAALRAPEPSRAALPREFIKDVFLAQQARPQHHAQRHKQQQHHHLRNEQTMAPEVEALPQRHPGRLPPRLARVRSSSKRNSDFDALAGDQIELADEPAATQLQPEQQSEASGANLFNSLGSMLFGATQEQQQHSDKKQLEPADSGGPLDPAAALLDGEPALSSVLRSVEGVGAPGSEGGEREPARLRSSALELDLSPEQSEADSPRESTAASQRPRAHRKQQQQQQQYQATASAVQQHQHDSTRHHANNHERPFDVALVQCNNTVEGFERFACPSPDLLGRYRCIEDRLFCDGYYDCPNGEDEDRVHCMYYRLFVSHIDILTNTFLTWMKNQNRQTNLGQHQHSAEATDTVQHQNQNQNQQHHQQQQQHHMTDAMALDT